MSNTTNPRIESEAQIIDGKLVISVSIETLAFAARNSEYFFHCAETGTPLTITNDAEFANSVRSILNQEECDGSTPVTRMLDRAFRIACDQGLDGVETASI